MTYMFYCKTTKTTINNDENNDNDKIDDESNFLWRTNYIL